MSSFLSGAQFVRPQVLRAHVTVCHGFFDSSHVILLLMCFHMFYIFSLFVRVSPHFCMFFVLYCFSTCVVCSLVFNVSPARINNFLSRSIHPLVPFNSTFFFSGVFKEIHPLVPFNSKVFFKARIHPLLPFNSNVFLKLESTLCYHLIPRFFLKLESTLYYFLRSNPPEI